jgi:hypothetical protein
MDEMKKGVGQHPFNDGGDANRCPQDPRPSKFDWFSRCVFRL